MAAGRSGRAAHPHPSAGAHAQPPGGIPEPSIPGSDASFCRHPPHAPGLAFAAGSHRGGAGRGGRPGHARLHHARTRGGLGQSRGPRRRAGRQRGAAGGRAAFCRRRGDLFAKPRARCGRRRRPLAGGSAAGTPRDRGALRLQARRRGCGRLRGRAARGGDSAGAIVKWHRGARARHHAPSIEGRGTGSRAGARDARAPGHRDPRDSSGPDAGGARHRDRRRRGAGRCRRGAPRGASPRPAAAAGGIAPAGRGGLDRRCGQPGVVD